MGLFSKGPAVPTPPGSPLLPSLSPRALRRLPAGESSTVGHMVPTAIPGGRQRCLRVSLESEAFSLGPDKITALLGCGVQAPKNPARRPGSGCLSRGHPASRALKPDSLPERGPWASGDRAPSAPVTESSQSGRQCYVEGPTECLGADGDLGALGRTRRLQARGQALPNYDPWAPASSRDPAREWGPGRQR